MLKVAFVFGIVLAGLAPTYGHAQSKKENPGLPTCSNTGWNQVGYKCFRKSDGKVCTMVGAFAGKGQWDCK